MLIGSGILPPEFFQATKNPFVLGVGARECWLAYLVPPAARLLLAALACLPAQAMPHTLTHNFNAVLMVCGFVMAWQRFYDEESADIDDDEEGLAKA